MYSISDSESEIKPIVKFDGRSILAWGSMASTGVFIVHECKRLCEILFAMNKVKTRWNNILEHISLLANDRVLRNDISGLNCPVLSLS